MASLFPRQNETILIISVWMFVKFATAQLTESDITVFKSHGTNVENNTNNWYIKLAEHSSGYLGNMTWFKIPKKPPKKTQCLPSGMCTLINFVSFKNRECSVRVSHI